MEKHKFTSHEPLLNVLQHTAAMSAALTSTDLRTSVSLEDARHAVAEAKAAAKRKTADAVAKVTAALQRRAAELQQQRDEAAVRAEQLAQRVQQLTQHLEEADGKLRTAEAAVEEAADREAVLRRQVEELSGCCAVLHAQQKALEASHQHEIEQACLDAETDAAASIMELRSQLGQQRAALQRELEAARAAAAAAEEKAAAAEAEAQATAEAAAVAAADADVAAAWRDVGERGVQTDGGLEEEALHDSSQQLAVSSSSSYEDTSAADAPQQQGVLQSSQPPQQLGSQLPSSFQPVSIQLPAASEPCSRSRGPLEDAAAHGDATHRDQSPRKRPSLGAGGAGGCEGAGAGACADAAQEDAAGERDVGEQPGVRGEPQGAAIADRSKRSAAVATAATATDRPLGRLGAKAAVYDWLESSPANSVVEQGDGSGTRACAATADAGWPELGREVGPDDWRGRETAADGDGDDEMCRVSSAGDTPSSSSRCRSALSTADCSGAARPRSSGSKREPPACAGGASSGMRDAVPANGGGSSSRGWRAILAGSKIPVPTASSTPAAAAPRSRAPLLAGARRPLGSEEERGAPSVVAADPLLLAGGRGAAVPGWYGESQYGLGSRGLGGGTGVSSSAGLAAGVGLEAAFGACAENSSIRAATAAPTRGSWGAVAGAAGGGEVQMARALPPLPSPSGVDEGGTGELSRSLRLLLQRRRLGGSGSGGAAVGSGGAGMPAMPTGQGLGPAAGAVATAAAAACALPPLQQGFAAAVRPAFGSSSLALSGVHAAAGVGVSSGVDPLTSGAAAAGASSGIVPCAVDDGSGGLTRVTTTIAASNSSGMAPCTAGTPVAGASSSGMAPYTEDVLGALSLSRYHRERSMLQEARAAQHALAAARHEGRAAQLRDQRLSAARSGGSGSGSRGGGPAPSPVHSGGWAAETSAAGGPGLSSAGMVALAGARLGAGLQGQCSVGHGLGGAGPWDGAAPAANLLLPGSDGGSWLGLGVNHRYGAE